MSMRHKAVKATLDRGYASEWNDDHRICFTDEIDDNLLLLGPVLTVLWDTGQTAGGAVPIWTLIGAAGSEHASVVLNTGGVTGQISAMRYMFNSAPGNICSPLDLSILTMAVEIAAVHTVGLVAEFGLQPSATAVFTALQAGAYFRIFDNKVYAVTGTGAAETTTDLGAFNQYGVYTIEFTSTSTKFYIDDMVNPVATHTTNRPVVALTPKVAVISANNVDSTVRIDAVGIQRLRKQ